MWLDLSSGLYQSSFKASTVDTSPRPSFKSSPTSNGHDPTATSSKTCLRAPSFSQHHHESAISPNYSNPSERHFANFPGAPAVTPTQHSAHMKNPKPKILPLIPHVHIHPHPQQTRHPQLDPSAAAPAFAACPVLAAMPPHHSL